LKNLFLFNKKTKIIDDLLKADKNSESGKIFSKNFRLNIKIKEALNEIEEINKQIDLFNKTINNQIK